MRPVNQYGYITVTELFSHHIQLERHGDRQIEINTEKDRQAQRQTGTETDRDRQRQR